MGESLNSAYKNSVGLFKQMKTFFGQHKYIPALAAIYILFHAFFEKLFTVAVVKSFLSYCTSSVLNDLIFIAIFLGIVIFCIYRIFKRYYISDKRFFISLILFLLLGYYRLTSDVWAFESFTFCDGLKYIDVILTFLFGDFFVKISFYFFNEEEADDKENKGFCLDAPLSESGTDRLNREDLVKQICERIKYTANKDASFAIGVTSEWGNGKTSFLNLIKRNLDKRQRVIIDYNPWLNSDKKSATLSFFDEMSSALKAYDSSLSNDILKYAKTLIDSSAGKYANLLNACLSLDGTLTLRERFEEINNAIQRTKLQIVVFIDDLDRLYDSEILEVLSLIRNSANFSNTIFIVAYDRNYLVAALKKVNDYHPQAYLEKIFQLELPLPLFERNVVSKLLFDKISPYLLDEDRDELNIILYKSDLFYINGIKTIRDLNRLVNSFLVSYDSLKGEIILSDLLNVELLRIKYPVVYTLLADNKEKFINLVSYRDIPFLQLTKPQNTEASKTKLEFYLENHFNELGLANTKIQDAMSYVVCAFLLNPKYVKDKPIEEFKSISHPIGINRYFHYRLLNSDISVVEFDRYRVLSDERFQIQLKKWIEEKKNGVSLVFENINTFASVEDYEKVIRAIFYCASLTYDSKEINFRDILIRKINFDFVKSFYQGYFGKSNFQNLIIKIFKDQPSPYTFSLSFIDKALNNIEPNDQICELSGEQLGDILIFYFDQYANSINEIDETFLQIYRICIYNRHILLHRKALEINKKTARRLPESYIKMYISKELNGYSIMQNLIIFAWGNNSYFEDYINSLDESNVKGITEFIEFYYQCKKEDFSPIPFEFKELDLHNMPLFESE